LQVNNLAKNVLMGHFFSLLKKINMTKYFSKVSFLNSTFLVKIDTLRG